MLGMFCSTLKSLFNEISQLDTSKNYFLVQFGMKMSSNCDKIHFHFHKKALRCLIFCIKHNLNQNPPFYSIIINQANNFAVFYTNLHHLQSKVKTDIFILFAQVRFFPGESERASGFGEPDLVPSAFWQHGFLGVPDAALHLQDDAPLLQLERKLLQKLAPKGRLNVFFSLFSACSGYGEGAGARSVRAEIVRPRQPVAPQVAQHCAQRHSLLFVDFWAWHFCADTSENNFVGWNFDKIID